MSLATLVTSNTVQKVAGTLRVPSAEPQKALHLALVPMLRLGTQCTGGSCLLSCQCTANARRSLRRSAFHGGALEREYRSFAVGRNKPLWAPLRRGVPGLMDLFDQAIRCERGCRNCASACYGLRSYGIRSYGLPLAFFRRRAFRSCTHGSWTSVGSIPA